MSASYRVHTLQPMRRTLHRERRNKPNPNPNDGKTRINCDCGRHLGDVLHSYAFQSGPLVVLRHAPNTLNRTDEDGTTTYRFGCKNHPGGTLFQQRTAREIADLFETSVATRSPIQLKRR